MLEELERSTSELGVKRIYYKDEEGRLVERLMTMSEDVDDVMHLNREQAHEYRPHQKGNIRKVASIPPALFVSWLMEEGVPGMCSEEAIDCVVNKKLRDAENKYLLTVPDNYRMMKNG